MVAAHKKDWPMKSAWKENRIASNQKKHMWILWVFTIIWNLMASPVFFSLRAELARGNYLILIATALPAFGVVLLYWSIKVTRDWYYFGEVVVQLDPFPGAIGGHVGGSIELPVRCAQEQQFYVQINCLRSYSSGSGEDSKHHESSIWQEDGIAKIESTALGLKLKFRFNVPNNLPETESVSDDYHYWRLDVESKNPAIKFSRQYEIPVFSTGEHSVLINQNSVVHPEMQKLNEGVLASVCKLEKIPNGAQLYFYPFRNWPTKLSLLIFGCIFASIGVGIYVSDRGSFFFCAIFSGIGSLCALSALYGLLNSLSIRLDKQGLEYRRKLLGVVVRELHISRREIHYLRLKQSYSSQRGGKKESVYSVKAKLNIGAEITIAESLRGQGAAELMLKTLSDLSGLRRGV